MFYAQYVLSKKGPLAKIWLAAHWEKKLTKAQVFETNVENAVEAILQPKMKMALRTTGHLLLGIVRIYSRKAKYLLADCNEAFLKIKMAFRPGQVDLPEEGREAALNAVTLPEVFPDFDSALPDFNEFDYQQQLTLNQSRIDDITMKEDLPVRSAFGSDLGLGIFGDDFGDGGFGDEEDMEAQRDEASANLRTPAAGVDASSRLIGSATPRLDLDAPIPDDFGGQFDNDMFMDDIFNDEALRDIENMDTAAPGEEEGAAEGLPLQAPPPAADSSFILDPLDASVMQGLERHRGRKKRKLVIDEVKNISGDEMKAQMHNYEDIVRTVVEIACPTRKLMRLKESSGVDKLFLNPATRGPWNKKLVKSFQSSLILGIRDEEEEKSKSAIFEELELRSHVDDDQESRFGGDAPLEHPNQLSVVPEEGQELSPIPPGDGGQLLPDPVQEEAPVPSVSPVAAPEGQQAESPPPTVGKQKEQKSPRRKSRSTVDHSRMEDSMDDADEPEDNKRWTKRTQQVLNTLHNKLETQEEVMFTDICRGATRKSAAQKFYTLLVLKKWQAIDVEQEEPFKEILITAGPQMENHLT